MFMKWARFCHLADDGCSALPHRKASQTFSAPWIPSCTPPLCPVQIHNTQNTSSCKYKYMKVEMCVWSSVCMRTAQPNAADESWLHFVMRRAVCILHHHLRVSRVYVFFSTKSMFCDGIFDMGRQCIWEKIKYITFGRPTTFFLIFGYPLLTNHRDDQGKKSKNFPAIEFTTKSLLWKLMSLNW